MLVLQFNLQQVSANAQFEKFTLRWHHTDGTYRKIEKQKQKQTFSFKVFEHIPKNIIGSPSSFTLAFYQLSLSGN